MEMLDFTELKEALNWCDIKKCKEIVNCMETKVIKEILTGTDYGYYTKDVLSNYKFKETRELISVEWDASKFTPLIQKYGYDRINEILKAMYEEEYEAKSDGN